MTDDGADKNSFLWGINPQDPDEVAAEREAQAAANRLANERAAAQQAAALAARRRPSAALPPQHPTQQPEQPPTEQFAAPPRAEDQLEDPFAIFTPPPTEATPLVLPEPTAPWVPGAFTAQQPIVPPPVQPPAAVPVFPVNNPAPASAAPSFPVPTNPEPAEPAVAPEAPPELVLPPEPQWPLPSQASTGQPTAAPWDQPTQAMPYVDMPTEAYDFEPPAQTYPWDPSSGAIPEPDPALAGITPLPPAQPAPVDEAPTTKLPSTDFDSLFGDEQFKEYDDESLLSPLVPGRTDTPPPPVLPRAPLTSTQRTLIWVAGSLVAVLALIGLFLFGTSLSGPAEVLPPVAQSPDAAEPEEPVAPTVGPVAPGTYAWDELLGTECIQPFESAWDEQFTVIDCGTPHAAQMLSKGVFDDEEDDAAGAEYPGVDALVERATEACESRDIINYGKAVNYKDIRVTASVPANAEQWTAGERDYYCFASRESGDPLNATITKTLKAE